MTLLDTKQMVEALKKYDHEEHGAFDVGLLILHGWSNHYLYWCPVTETIEDSFDNEEFTCWTEREFLTLYEGNEWRIFSELS